MELTDSEAAYIAGILDGEGSISLNRNGRWRRLSVSVDTTDEELAHWLKTKLGGIIARKKVYKSHHKQAWSWRIKDQKAKTLLERVLPFLVIDRRRTRALAGMLYVSTTKTGGHYNEEQVALRTKLEKQFFGR